MFAFTQPFKFGIAILAIGIVLIDSISVFQPLGTDDPTTIFRDVDHPLKREHFDVGEENSKPIQTNKFYANLFLSDQSNPVFMMPYSCFLKRSDYTGFACQHAHRGKWHFSPDPDHFYMFAPPFEFDVLLGAEELKSNVEMTLKSPDVFSVTAQLSENEAKVSFPLVQGQAFLTAVYENATPRIVTSNFITDFIRVTPKKYRVTFNNGEQWLIYASNNLDLIHKPGDGVILAASSFQGFLQVSKGSEDSEAVLDRAAGVYATSIRVDGVAYGNGQANYSFVFDTLGHKHPGNLLHYALPHQQESLYYSVSGISDVAELTNLSLEYITRGKMRAVSGQKWTFLEPDLPYDIGFLPKFAEDTILNENDLRSIREAAVKDISKDFKEECNKQSYYFAGKCLQKYSLVCLVANKILNDTPLSDKCLNKLQDALEARLGNKGVDVHLVYDKTWKGLITEDGLTDPHANFGNAYYNDHHFHYGYIIFSSAVLAYLRPQWLDSPSREAVDFLIRDTSNPSTNDPYFPFMRCFDFYNGHSFAKGIFVSADGKDQESTSEDTNFSYAIKLWGIATSDKATEERGNLMLAIQRRSFADYFLISFSNTVQAPELKEYSVTGILFENKIDHATYFGLNEEYIHGIHMLPVTSMSPYVRRKSFVAGEWQHRCKSKLHNHRDAWDSVMKLDRSIVEPEISHDYFFSSEDFALDDGQSLTWSRYYSAYMLQNSRRS